MSLRLPDDAHLPDRPSEKRIGYTQPERLEAAVVEEVGELVPSDAKEPPGFVDEALNFLRRRLSTAGAQPTGLVVIVSAVYPRVVAEAFDMKEVPGFRFSNTVPLAGRLFVGSNLLAQVFEQEIGCSDPAEIFKLLKTIGLGDRPALIVDLSATDAIWCPTGAGDDATAAPVPLWETVPAEPSTPDALVESVEEFVATWQATPGIHPGVWADEASFVVAGDAEKQIREILFPIVRQRFRATHIIRCEDHIVDGRSDISLTTREPVVGSVREVSLLGITVIGTFFAPRFAGQPPMRLVREDNEEIIERGLAAAEEYCTLTGCRTPTWFAFDMQQADDSGRLVAGCQPSAQSRRVQLRRCLVPNRSRTTVTAGW